MSLQPFNQALPAQSSAAGRSSLIDALANGRLRRDLSRLGTETVYRVARVQAEGIVATEKVRELDNLGREAMDGQALLARQREVQARGDLFLADELRLISDRVLLAKAEVIADTASSYCRESRGLR